MPLKRHTRAIVVTLLALASLWTGVVPGSGQSPPPAVIEPALAAILTIQGQASLFLMFAEQADLSPAFQMAWQQRGNYVYESLKSTAEGSQARARAFLDEHGIPYQAFLVDNSIYVPHATSELAVELAALHGVAWLRLERSMPVPEIAPARDQPMVDGVEWGVAKINADDVWAMGYSGQGIVVANTDTGVRYTHAALVNQYRGNQGGGSFVHTYSWYDPTGTYPGAPGDNHGHGTHTMGIMAGDDGGANQIGVAPGARWIACKGCTSTVCYDAHLNACADWMLAPGGDPGQRPHVINNSWAGCGYDPWYRAKTDAWLASGITPVFAAGNTSNCGYGSPFCGSIGNPATYRDVTAVGSTTNTDSSSSFSLWGPSQDPQAPGEIKPDVSAPGSSIRSAYAFGDTNYAVLSGTSMAAPNYAGALALLWSACPSLRGNFAASEQRLKDHAARFAYATGCGNEGPGNIPNNAFGYGRIDVLAAIAGCTVVYDHAVFMPIGVLAASP